MMMKFFFRISRVCRKRSTKQFPRLAIILLTKEQRDANNTKLHEQLSNL